MKPERRGLASNNSGPMADIAFLLLVFFLLVSTIDSETGISTQLAKATQSDEPYEIVQTELLLNKAGQFMLNGQGVGKGKLVEELVSSYRSEAGIKNVLMLNCEREVAYPQFLSALDQVKQSFAAHHEQLAQSIYQQDYENLTEKEKLQIRTSYPVALAEDIQP